jgi:hypothetical protein
MVEILFFVGGFFVGGVIIAGIAVYLKSKGMF